ncbi:formate dehydrogenase accessory sulfurtransferase FdhD [Algibacillus agarilyticus]|uniref:formate dehydrogenase accessory sulfurtransferase FdhD n=1 Tax=Algibacillus agarilyticus TaxID=2234133 RepID=UPI000DD0A6B8|nr:formate dehydrogenase accessory sulfurtransferase FdhD [Algibacillus agarilyticus]
MLINNPIEQLVEESPIAININGLNYAVMMATPDDLDDYAIGFLLSEGIIEYVYDVHDIQIQKLDEHVQINIEVAQRCFTRLKHQQRQIKGTTGCGLCGKKAIEHAFPPLTTHLLHTQAPLKKSQLLHIKNELNQWQIKGQQTGAIHAAFWLNPQGKILTCREDIGRHNAVDKIIGTALTHKYLRQNASILVTSRCSIELVQKAIKAQVSNLISLASPSQLAVKTAAKANLNLIHIPRKDLPIYYHRATYSAQRYKPDEPNTHALKTVLLF